MTDPFRKEFSSQSNSIIISGLTAPPCPERSFKNDAKLVNEFSALEYHVAETFSKETLSLITHTRNIFIAHESARARAASEHRSWRRAMSNAEHSLCSEGRIFRIDHLPRGSRAHPAASVSIFMPSPRIINAVPSFFSTIYSMTVD